MSIKKICYRLVYNRRNQLNCQGEALVQIEASLHRRKIYISTHLYLPPQCWDKQTSQVINHIHSNELNSMLWEKVLELQGVEISFWKRGLSPSLYELKLALKVDTAKLEASFYDFAEQIIAGSSRQPATKNNLLTTVRNLRKWRGNLSFKDMTYACVTDYERYLQSLKLQRNTVSKHLCNLRTLVNEAVRCGFICRDEYPFLHYKIKKGQTEHRVLTREELAMLERYEPQGEKNRQVLDAFLFCCYTGLRYSDFCHLTSSQFVEINGQTWIDFKSIKTGIRQRIPVGLLYEGKALALLKKYGRIEGMTCLGRNAVVNRCLKAVCFNVGIVKRVTFHVARHTFATLLLYEGVSITSI